MSEEKETCVPSVAPARGELTRKASDWMRLRAETKTMRRSRRAAPSPSARATSSTTMRLHAVFSDLGFMFYALGFPVPDHSTAMY